MGSMVYEWMKNLAVFYIFLSVIMNLVPNSKYGEPIRFFMGILLISLILSPILNLFQLEEKAKEFLKEYEEEETKLESQFQEWEFKWTPQTEYTQEGYLQKGYQEEVQRQILDRLEQEGYQVEQVTVSLEKEKQNIEKIRIDLVEYPGEEGKRAMKDELGETYGITEENIGIFPETFG